MGPFYEIVPLHVLLADDDLDDRFFFDKALKTVPFKTHLEMFDNGETLLSYLFNNLENLPDVIFLDHNMPKMNGFECLSEIKNDPKLRKLPVIMYSTYLHEDVADILYNKGAYYYIRKTDFNALKEMLQYILTLVNEGKFVQPTRDAFILSMTTKV